MTRTFAVPCLVLALAVGCAPSNPGIVIDGLVAPPDSCEYDPSSDVFLLRPVLDTTSFAPQTYTGVVRLTNRLIALANNRYPLRAEPNVMSIDYAEVEILQVDGTRFAFDGLPNPFRVVAAGTIPPSTGLEGTPGITAIELIPLVYGQQLTGLNDVTLVISVRVTATTAGAATITSADWAFPLQLCAGCLLGCNCGATMDEPTCFPGQDEVYRLSGDDPLCAACPAT
jgi:hypothetical protein